MHPHIRVELPRIFNASTGEDNPGAKRIAISDRIIAVGENGEEIDLSASCVGWKTVSKYGNIVSLKLELLGFEIERIERVEQATAAPGELR